MPQKPQGNCTFMNSASVFKYARRSAAASDGFVRSMWIRDMIRLLLFIALTGINLIPAVSLVPLVLLAIQAIDLICR
jgi:hypothetical protein